MNRDDDTTAILPWMRKRYTAFKMDATPVMVASTSITNVRGTSQSGFAPVRMRSTNTFPSDVYTMPTSETMAAVSIVNPTAGPRPSRRLRANPIVSGFLPPSSNASVFANTSATPVNESSNSFIGTLIWPRAGSFR